MPSSNQGSSSHVRARFPEVKAEVGEDPARFLDYSFMQNQDARFMAKVRIASIDRLAVARAWISVEHDLERGPRRKVIEWLRERIVFLKEYGERPARLKERDGRTTPETEWRINGQAWTEVDRTAAISSGRSFDRASAGGDDG